MGLYDIAICIIGAIVVLVGWVLFEWVAERGPVWVRAFRERYFITSSDEDVIDVEYESVPVPIPVAPTGTVGHTSNGVENTSQAHLPDMDANIPPVSRHLSDDTMIVLLACQRRANGKHRYSANQIATFVGGDRNHVLSIVRQVREAPAEWPRPLTPDEQATTDAIHAKM